MRKGLDLRLQVLGLMLAAAFVVLILQLANVQIRQGPSLVNSKYNIANQVSQNSLPRGAIISADHVVLAYSKPVSDVFKEQRIYTMGPLFAQIVGYDSIYYGKSGIEAYYDRELSTHVPKASLSNLFAAEQSTDNVVLTVPAALEQQVAADLASAIGPERVGAVVALDPRSGAILAAYAQPTFDPTPLVSHDINQEKAYWNSLAPSSPSSPLINGWYGQVYAPGSTFKVVTTSAAFDHPPYPGFASTFSAPFVSEISLPDSNKGLHNYAYEVCGGHIPQLLTVSCDTGYALMGLDLGYKAIAAEAGSFGFNARPPLDSDGVAVSSFPSGCSVLPFIAYCAIGQYSVTASALQMALVAAAIANDGAIMRPHLMQAITDAFGRVIETYNPQVWRFATTPQTARQVRQDMILVAEHGTAAGLFPSNLVVAAKTGTAQTTPGAGNNNWLIAFAPAGPGQTPEVAVAAVVPEQAGLGQNTTGAQIAGPIAAKVLMDALNWENSHQG